MHKKKLHEKIFFCSLMVLAFTLPVVPRFSGIVMAFMMLHWLLQFDYVNRFKLLMKNKPALLMIIFYFLFLLGMAWTENLNDGEQKIILLTSIWMLPLLFATSTLFPTSKEKILQAFVAGCFVSAAICLGYATVILNTQHKNIFFYSQLTDVLHLHPSYSGVYVLFACMLLLRKWFKKKMDDTEKIGTIALLLFFFVFLILLSARAQLIILLLMIPAMLFYKNLYKQPRKKNATIKTIVVSVVLILLLAGSAFLFSGTRTRMIAMVNDWNSAYSETDPKSIPERKVIWQCAAEIIQQHALAGVGTGDAHDVLKENFLKHNWHLLAERNFNSHNEFLQLSIMLGLPGLLYFIFLIWALWKQARREQQILLLGFLFIFSISMLTEAMLESEAGVVFFSFIIGLLACKPAGNEIEISDVSTAQMI